MPEPDESAGSIAAKLAEEIAVKLAEEIAAKLKLDERLSRVEAVALQLAQTEKDLGTLAWKLAAAKTSTSWISGAVAGAVVVAVWILLASRLAIAYH